MKLDRFKREALRREFPFLSSFKEELSKAEELSIGRIDAEFLSHTPSEYSVDGSVVGISRGEEISLVISDGTVIKDAVKQEYEHRSNYAHTDTSIGDGETVLHAIDRHGVQVDFVVVRHYGIHTENHFSFGSRLVILKPAKGFRIKEIISEAYQKASGEVRAEANF